MIISNSLKDKYKHTECTLNGLPASISGANYNKYARVIDSKTGLWAEWDWIAVHNVMTKKSGRFESY